ncbi:MAG: hypothetical protein KC561_19970, partial [Myxococcales bacterium]|nr:hypothetical protein [Myxococcales bacterium]
EVVWELDGGNAESTSDPRVREVSWAEPGEYIIEVETTDESGEVFVTGAFVRVFESGPQVLGDADGDGDLDQDDVDAVEASLAAQVVRDDSLDLAADINLNGIVDADDLSLMEQAVGDGNDAPVFVEPETGSRGTAITIIHPALLDPSRDIRVQFGSGESYTLSRGAPGYAVALVPPDRTAPEVISMNLLDGDSEVGNLPFTIIAPPVVAEASDRILDVMTDASQALEAVPTLISAWAMATDLSEEEWSVLVGIIEETTEVLAEQQAEFAEAYQLLDPDAQILWEEIALANGLADVETDLSEILDSLTDLLASIDQISFSDSARIVSLICTARQIADISAKVAYINEIVGTVLGYLDFPGASLIPWYGQIVSALSAVSEIISTITDVIDIVMAFIPEFSDSLQVTPS